MTRRHRLSLACALGAAATLTVGAQARAAITPVSGDAGAAALAQQAFHDAGILGGTAQFATQPGGASAGFAGAFGSVFPTSGSDFAILATGLAASADDPNANDPDDAGAGTDKTTQFSTSTVRGTSDYDVTVLKIPFTAPATANCLTMDFQFLSEEYAEYVGGAFNDAFIAELDGSSWDTVGQSTITAPDNFAFDSEGDVVSVNAIGLGGFSRANAAGTTYDGATPLLRASKQITPGAHDLYLSIFDQGDPLLDSAAFVDNVRVGFVPDPAKNCKPGAQVALYSLTLTPETGTRTTTDTHSVTATLTDDDGNPVVGAPVAFAVTGPNAGTGTAVTGPDGKATYSYTGAAVGTDTISALYDVDADGTAEAADSAQVEWTNTAPDCSTAAPDVAEIKQNDHKFNPVTIGGITDADGDTVTTTITTVEQDEALNGLADGNTDVDARRTASDDTVEVRAERSGLGDGRVYVISFTGDDGKGGTCTGTALVGVPHDQRGGTAVDSGARHDSFGS